MSFCQRVLGFCSGTSGCAPADLSGGTWNSGEEAAATVLPFGQIVNREQTSGVFFEPRSWHVGGHLGVNRFGSPALTVSV